MNKKTFDEFRRIVYEKSGISLSEGKDALMQARVGKRMRSLGITECDDYLMGTSKNSFLLQTA